MGCTAWLGAVDDAIAGRYAVKWSAAHVLLLAWARWASRRASGAAGYASTSVLLRMAPSARQDARIDDLTCMALNSAIDAMREQDVAGWFALRAYYVGDPEVAPMLQRPLSVEAIAKRLGCARSTAYLHLSRARKRVSSIRKK